MTYSASVFQFTNLLQAIYTHLEQTKTILATGGGTGTIVDTTLGTQYITGSFLNWTAFIVRDAGGAAAAPEGEFQRVSAYNASTKTITVASVFSAAVAAGDRVLLARATPYPLQDVIAICNQVIQTRNPIKQMYTGWHTTLSAYTDLVSEFIPPELAIAACALAIAEWKSVVNPDLIPKLRDAYAQALTIYPVQGTPAKTQPSSA